MRRENFLKGVWLGGRERKKMWWDLGVFSLNSSKCFFPKMGRKLGKREWFVIWTKILPVAFLRHFAPSFFFFFYLFIYFLIFKLNFLGNIGSFFFFFFFWKNVGFLILFFIYLFSWGCGGDSDLFSFCYFFFLTWFLFFNKFGWLRFFFLLVCHFLFLIGHYFLTRVCE